MIDISCGYVRKHGATGKGGMMVACEVLSVGLRVKSMRFPMRKAGRLPTPAKRSFWAMAYEPKKVLKWRLKTHGRKNCHKVTTG